LNFNATAACNAAIGCPPLHECRGGVFAAVAIIPSVRFGTTVTWVPSPNSWLAPVVYRLEVNRTGSTMDQQDWSPVTPWQADISHGTDTRPRADGWYDLSHYRVAVRDGNGLVQYSAAIRANQASLSRTQARTANEILRREHKRLHLASSAATPGYLLKVRFYGNKCALCVDPDSGEPTRTNCPQCYGTGYVSGYHKPVPCFNADIGPSDEEMKLPTDVGLTLAGGVCSLRFVNEPNVFSADVWVNAVTDDRYIIGQIASVSSINGVRLVGRATAARLSYDHPVYAVPVGNRDA